MAQLIEPGGTENTFLPVADAIAFCASHPGWSRRNGA
jgi:hypothetical protein